MGMAVKGNRKGRKKTQSSGTLFKAVVQAFLIFGSEMCVMTPCMDRMLGGYRSGNVSLRPDTYAFAALLDAWIVGGSWEAGGGVIGVLDLVEDLSRSSSDDGGKPLLTPGPYSMVYNAAMKFFFDKGDEDEYGAER